jgi:hypothetical protein
MESVGGALSMALFALFKIAFGAASPKTLQRRSNLN